MANTFSCNFSATCTSSHFHILRYGTEVSVIHLTCKYDHFEIFLSLYDRFCPVLHVSIIHVPRLDLFDPSDRVKRFQSVRPSKQF